MTTPNPFNFQIPDVDPIDLARLYAEAQTRDIFNYKIDWNSIPPNKVVETPLGLVLLLAYDKLGDASGISDFNNIFYYSGWVAPKIFGRQTLHFQMQFKTYGCRQQIRVLGTGKVESYPLTGISIDIGEAVKSPDSLFANTNISPGTIQLGYGVGQFPLTVPLTINFGSQTVTGGNAIQQISMATTTGYDIRATINWHYATLNPLAVSYSAPWSSFIDLDPKASYTNRQTTMDCPFSTDLIPLKFNQAIKRPPEF